MLEGPTLGGSLVALVFWWQSLTPTLIPRSWPTQVVIGAVCLAIGYGMGALAGRLMHWLFERSGRSAGDVVRRGAWVLLGAAWLVGVILGSTRWMGWQNEQRILMRMTSVVWLDAALMAVLSPVAGAVLVMVGRVIASGVSAIHRFIRRRVAMVVAVPATALVVVVLGIVLVRGVAGRALTAAAQFIFATANEGTTQGTLPPESPSVSGGSASLVTWRTLGRMGRDFVATVTTAQELRAFHGADANITHPVRVYVGVDSVGSLAERAALAVRELERAGGFDRKVLVVWVPTGRGWIVPKAATSLEQLHRGDTAIVAIQYSSLPSVLSVFMDAGFARQAGITLFTTVRARWLELPADRRPKLVVFAKSLGTAGVEAPFVGVDASASVANMVAQTDGALIVGAKHSNPIHSQLTGERDPGSPVWQPVFRGGRTVRFLNRDPDQTALDTTWSGPRVVYLQHPSDPTVFWGVEAFWWPPEWMDRPRGFDVPNHSRWFPIVSGVQAVGDMIHQLRTPPGFGHDYSTEYVKGWVSVLRPEGWTDADTERLEQFVDKMAGDDTEP